MASSIGAELFVAVLSASPYEKTCCVRLQAELLVTIIN
jgi:hypothetical protein